MHLHVQGAGVVEGERLMVHRDIANLLSNALRYGDSGSTVMITVTCEADAVVLAVTNRGDTVAPAHLDRLFDRFYRVDSARQRPQGDGSGLGLAISKAIVLAHGGRIDVCSHKRTTVFSVHLPAMGSVALKSSSDAKV